jgi:hypothetical protein
MADLAQALDAAKAGYDIWREAWGGQHKVVFVRGFPVNTLRVPRGYIKDYSAGPPEAELKFLSLTYRDHFARIARDGSAEFWVPTPGDLVAVDWDAALPPGF